MRTLLAVTIALLTACTASANERWTVYYGHSLKVEAFAPFHLVILDSENTAPIQQLKAEGKTVLGYFSLGESENYRTYYKDIKAKKLLLAPNPQWPDHRVIDIRNPEWERMVNDVFIPQLVEQGFDGVMLDTIDSPLHIEWIDGKQYTGMNEAAIRLVCSIRKHHPDLKIMLNRGFEILPEVAGCIDMVMAETIRTDMQPKDDKKPYFTSPEDYEKYIATLQTARQKNPSLKIYSLDYWPMEDHAGVARIYQEQREQGFIPYVSTIDLQNVFAEVY